MGELTEGLPPSVQEGAQPSDARRETTAQHDLGIRLRIQFELIAECYGLPSEDAIDNEFFTRWVDDGYATWFNDFIHNPEIAELIEVGNIEEAKIKIRAAFQKRRSGVNPEAEIL